MEKIQCDKNSNKDTHTINNIYDERNGHLHKIFETQVDLSPDAIALVSPQLQLTYQQLNQRANQLAHHLQSLGIGPEVAVGVCVEHSSLLIIALLAILKAGGVYLPLDPAYPQARLSFLLSDAQVPFLLTQSQIQNRLPATKAHHLLLETLWEDLAQEPGHNLSVPLSLDNCAYVIYTSGSTGTPKGVQISHRGIANLLHAQQSTFALRIDNRILLCASPSFDASIFEMVMALLTGATLCLGEAGIIMAGATLARYLREQAITNITVTPSVLSTVPYDVYPSLCTVIVAGEACGNKLIKTWAQGRAFYNAYGPTEGTIWATVARCRVEEQQVSIGEPIANTQVYLLDSQMELVPMGAEGELYIGGIGLARGYLNRPELTAGRFVPDPFGLLEGNRLYRTGDRGRYLANGMIEYLGRVDEQVKLHGFRIELGEIESVLRRHSAVQDALVLMQENAHGDKSLVAYIVSDPQYWEHVKEREEAKDFSDTIKRWEAISDNVYSQSHLQPDAAFNTTGWNSSYTGQPIPEAEMQEWADQTVQRILSLRPDRVWEIGCGVGLLLLQIAPQCKQYWGTDISAVAIDLLQQQVISKNLSQVTLIQKAANNFDGIAARTFDSVILNSVAQSFPSVYYLLRVLEGAVNAVASGGFIFVGDVRSFSLLHTFHTSVQFHRAPDSLSLVQLQQRIQQGVAQEEELTIDPAFFTALQSHLPRISHVQIMLKRGRYHNELTRFRYDAVLHIGEVSPPSAKDFSWLDWQQQKLTLLMLRQLLTETNPATLGISNVANARLQGDLRVEELLATCAELETVGDLRKALQAAPYQEAIDPEDLWELGNELQYAVNISWSDASAPACCDIVFRRSEIALVEESMGAPLLNQAGVRKQWKGYANNPLQKESELKLLSELRNFLQNMLPHYMLPAFYVLLETLPRTPNGKVDRQALQSPSQENFISRSFVYPRTPTEETIKKIWVDVLKVEDMSIYDHFFEIGGHSLLAIQALSRIRDIFHVELSLQSLFQAPTIVQLAAVIEEAKTNSVKAQTIPMVRLSRNAYRRAQKSIENTLGQEI